MDSNPEVAEIKTNAIDIKVETEAGSREEGGGLPEIHRLVDSGDVEKLKHFRYSAVLESRDRAGFTPLHRACAHGQIDVVKILIQNGADVHAMVDRRRATPLHIAAEYGRADIVAELLGASAQDICKRDHEGDTPLHEAALRADAHILQQLWPHFLAYRQINPDLLIPLDLPNGKHLTLLHYAAGRGNLDAVTFLLANGADTEARDSAGATPFHFAARCGSVEVMEAFTNCLRGSLDSALNAQLNCLSNNNLSALHYASWNGHHEAVTWLISKGAQVHVMDHAKGDTPLHWAARNGSPKVIHELINGGAKVFFHNKCGELPMGIANDYGHGPAIKSIFKALTTATATVVDIKDMNVMIRHRDDAILLHYAAGYTTKDDIDWLLEKMKGYIAANKEDKKTKLNVLVNSKDKEGRNAMHWAAMKGNSGVIKALADIKIDFEVKDKKQQTPLTLALIHDLSCAEVLVTLPFNAISFKQKWVTDSFDSWAVDFKETMKKNTGLTDLLKCLNSSYPISKDKPINEHINELIEDMTSFYIALFMNKTEIAKFIHKHGTEDIINKKGPYTGRTALHWATLLNNRKIVSKVCRADHDFEKDLVANMEDKFGRTALEYATEMELKDIKKELMERTDVRSYVEGLYRDRQLFVDAANAILVGAALIASVTFAGWLQPPLCECTMQEYPKHIGIRVFWAFNSLSFLFSISTVLVGASAVLPMGNIFIARAVSNIRQRLLLTATLLSFSIIFVVGAFVAAGFTVLPSRFKYQENMMATTIVGGTTCILCLMLFLVPLFTWRPSWRPSWMKKRKTCHGHFDSITVGAPRITSEGLEYKKGEMEYKKGERYSFLPWDDGLDGISRPNT